MRDGIIVIGDCIVCHRRDTLNENHICENCSAFIKELGEAEHRERALEALLRETVQLWRDEEQLYANLKGELATTGIDEQSPFVRGLLKFTLKISIAHANMLEGILDYKAHIEGTVGQGDHPGPDTNTWQTTNEGM